MVKVINQFIIFCTKRKPYYGFIISAIITVFGFMSEDLCSYISSLFNFGDIITTFFIFVIISVFIIVFDFLLSRNRNKKSVELKELQNKYKGLIVSISKIKVPDKEVVGLIDEVSKLEKNIKSNLKIAKNSVDVRSLEKQLDNLYIKLFGIEGIGQTFRAIMKHQGKLKVCWLLYTDKSENEKDIVIHFLKKVQPDMIPRPILIENPSSLTSIHKTVNTEIFSNEIEELNSLDDDLKLEESDVISDITGGTKLMSGAIIMACMVFPERNMQYVDQDSIELIDVKNV
ncbi:hypothetical protein MSHOH_1952 [Methanosarcina horonobensis HB-1 = JCM 15518]|uniref:Uncharacterized protein n=1 Tax=Methanosarcina horonobensis HB-1 = JCM 15518 TaxID=1434110 RepID=A0A0E3WTD1_9EURY|nr:hypothetical protein [Methanosarcina horonobensis]AKB78435.1 hypothetical protein MSHOH_1952 [Methanosarcina horonobensis HB-1 = JCM 15518]